MSPMLIKIGGKAWDLGPVPDGQTGTGDHFSPPPSFASKISRPGWPGRWKRRVMLP